MKKNVLFLIAISFSVCFADMHPGLKAAIDAGNVKQAKNLVEKMGVVDIYCPASLKLSDARKIYKKAFDETPLLFLDSSHYYGRDIEVDSAFLDGYVAKSCAGKKDNDIKVCDAWMKKTTKRDWDKLEKSFCQTKEGTDLCKLFLDSTNIYDRMPYFLQLEKKNILEYKETKEIDTVVAVKLDTKECLETLGQYCKSQKIVIQDKYQRGVGRTWNFAFGICNLDSYAYYKQCLETLDEFWREGNKECSSGTLTKGVPKKVKKDVIVRPYHNHLKRYYNQISEPDWTQLDENWIKEMKFLSRHDYSEYGPFFDVEKNYMDRIKSSYATSGTLSASYVLAACALYPSIDKKLEKEVEMRLFSCPNVRKSYNSDCSGKSDGDRISKPRTLGGTDSLIYICEEKRWRLARFDESLGECSLSRQGEIRDPANSPYPHQETAQMVCDSNTWRYLSEQEKSGGFCSDSLYEKRVVVHDSAFMCDGQHWRVANWVENVAGFCDSVKELKKLILDDEFFYCRAGEWVKTDKLTYTYGFCNDSRDGVVSCLTDFNCFSCEKGKWREATEEEKNAKFVCNISNIGKVTDDYQCGKSGWQKRTRLVETLGWCSAEMNGKIKNFDGGFYYCENFEWRKATDLECAHHFFNNPKATGMDWQAGAVCNKGLYGKVMKNFICTAKGWKKASKVEMIHGLCNAKNQGKIAPYSNSESGYVICDENEWYDATDEDVHEARERGVLED